MKEFAKDSYRVRWYGHGTGAKAARLSFFVTMGNMPNGSANICPLFVRLCAYMPFRLQKKLGTIGKKCRTKSTFLLLQHLLFAEKAT